MRTNIRIPLGKKDISINEWWNLAIASEMKVSNVIVMCLDYYRITGKFLHIADIICSDASIEPTLKTAYIPETSNVYKWLDERQQQGDKVARIIKYVLRNSIATQQISETALVSQDFLFAQIEQLKYKSKEVIKQTVSEVEKEEIAVPLPQYESLVKTETDYKNAESSEEIETGENDIFSALIGNNGLQL